MPIYQYICDPCENKFDFAKSVNDDTIPKCNTCGNNARKVFSLGGIMFTGSGFYSTDNRKK
jgi:putative FmdB family regulatory protein